MWRRTVVGLAGVGLALVAALVLGVGLLEAYAILTSPPGTPTSDGIVVDAFRPWWFPWSHLVPGGTGLFAATRLLRQAV